MSENLFSAFQEASVELWQQQVAKELKEKPLDSLTQYLPNLTIEPYYSSSPTNQLQPLFHHTDWLIKQQFVVQDAKLANQEILKALANDVQVLGIVFQSDVQPDTFNDLFNGVYLNMIQLHFDYKFVSRDLQYFIEYIEAQKYQREDLHITINTSLLFWSKQNEEVKTIFSLLTQKSIPNKILTISVADYKSNEVVLEVQQLFLKLKDVFSWAKQENIANVEKQLYFIVSLSPNYFLQIAKLRAIRILWQQFLIDNNIPVVPAYIHAINSWNYNTAVDHENILRHTTEAMSAIIGGCDVLFLTTSDEAAQMNTVFLNRINTNIQHLLKHESHFNKVQDMAAGSYYIENITAQIVAAAMAK